ncbi:MAG: biotin/lipoate A/B protein ligase family protein [Pirellulales bacterium]
MRLLDHSCATAEENLAFDEALLDEAEAPRSPGAGQANDEVLRFWESPSLAVVLGRGCRAAYEVDLAACRRDRVPVLRRTSGGGTVLIGPGSLMYTLLLSKQSRPPLRAIDSAHRAVLERHATALSQLIPTVHAAGTSDLAVEVVVDTQQRVCKFSGNSLRVRRDWVLYHGTLLYDFPLDELARYLRPPPREPDYRQHRQHAEFVVNVPVSASDLRRAIAAAWDASEPCDEALQSRVAARTEQLVADKYDRDDWNLQI